ncbi:Argk [Bugula neritina]|uniref:Argk n=1 Tax=Bugula neritina TaxID=10212 RepID=A0A7J7JWF7_BUGNE|nr:Argk [Bugula neritina]
MLLVLHLVGKLNGEYASIAALPVSAASISSFDNYPDFEGHKHLIGKLLTRELYDQLKGLKTHSGCTLDRCMQGGVDNYDFSVGCAMGDEESYTLFGDVMYSVIEGRHVGYKRTDIHKSDLDPSKLIGGDLDPQLCRLD